MKLYKFSIGLFDKDTKKQEIETEVAKDIVFYEILHGEGANVLQGWGRYIHEETGEVVIEPSIFIEYYDFDGKFTRKRELEICREIRERLNQESVAVIEIDLANSELVKANTK